MQTRLLSVNNTSVSPKKPSDKKIFSPQLSYLHWKMEDFQLKGREF